MENYKHKERLIDTIEQDCRLWEKLNNKDKMITSYMYLQECDNSKESGIYQLILNGGQLWYGTLMEINAIVKSMIYRTQTNDFEEEYANCFFKVD